MSRTFYLLDISDERWQTTEGRQRLEFLQATTLWIGSENAIIVCQKPTKQKPASALCHWWPAWGTPDLVNIYDFQAGWNRLTDYDGITCRRKLGNKDVSKSFDIQGNIIIAYRSSEYVTAKQSEERVEQVFALVRYLDTLTGEIIRAGGSVRPLDSLPEVQNMEWYRCQTL